MSEVIHLFPPADLARECVACGSSHQELGVLCVACRGRQVELPADYLTGIAASTISDLERWERQGHPLSGPLADALRNARRMYDAVTPRIRMMPLGEVHYLSGEFWGFPVDADGVQLGPFGEPEQAEQALVEFSSQEKPRDP